MKVACKFLSNMKLDKTYSLLSARDVRVVLEFFKALDVRGEMALDGEKCTATCSEFRLYLSLYS